MPSWCRQNRQQRRLVNLQHFISHLKKPDLKRAVCSPTNVSYTGRCNATFIDKCSFFSIWGALKINWSTGSPSDIIKDKDTKLKCIFSGWPLPQDVYWYKDGYRIDNGTKGIYLYHKSKGEKLHSILHLPPGREEQEGNYKCSATSRIRGWSSSASRKIQMVYPCKTVTLVRYDLKKAIRKVMGEGSVGNS